MAPQRLDRGNKMQEKMIFEILLLATLTCGVCGTFDVGVSETFYEAAERDDITMEWTFTTRADRSPDALNISCTKVNNHREIVVFRLAEGVQVPESQDEQFAGRVLFDEDVLAGGRLSLNVSSLRAEDSGAYMCVVKTEYGQGINLCSLRVRAARSSERRSSDRWEWTDVFSKLCLTTGLLAVIIGLCLHIECVRTGIRRRWRLIRQVWSL